MTAATTSSAASADQQQFGKCAVEHDAKPLDGAAFQFVTSARRMSDFDIVIVGGGIAGASLGAEIAGKRRTLIIEAEEQCGYHSTGRSAAFCLESYGGPVVATAGCRVARFPGRTRRSSSPSAASSAHAAHFTYRASDWPELPPGVDGRQGGSRTSSNAMDSRDKAAVGARPFSNRAAPTSTSPAFTPRSCGTSAGVAATDRNRRGARIGGLSQTAGGSSSLPMAIELTAPILVNAAGAWADQVAERCGVRAARHRAETADHGPAPCRPIGPASDLPLVNDSDGTFLFQGRERPIASGSARMTRSRASPATPRPRKSTSRPPIDRFEAVVDWPIEAVERSWAGLRSFAPDRLPVYGFDAAMPGILLVRRAGRLRHPDRAGRGKACCRAPARRGAAPKRRAHRIRRLLRGALCLSSV